MGSGGVAIAALFIVICLEVPFSDGLGGGPMNLIKINMPEPFLLL
jgi:hypothetical protein